MSNTIQFTINLDGNAYTGIAQLDKVLGKFNVSATSTPKLMERINNAAFKINNLFQAAQNTIGKVGNAIGKIVEIGGENELQKLDMTTLFQGNTAAAEEMFEKISEYGKATVYDKSGLIDAQKTMMSFGIEGEKAFSTLKQIGDIAMGDSQKMQSLALAFSQATSAGKLQGQDLNQLINAGFNPLNEISKHTGESVASLREKMSKGQISAEMLTQAFAWATEEGGLFYQGAEKAGDSTMGKINQLKDTFDEFLIDVFNKLKPVIDTCLSFATGFLETLPALLDGIANGVSNVIGFFSEFAPIIIGVATAITILATAINISNISLKLQDFWLNILIVKEKAISMWTKVWAGAQAILNAVMSLNPITLIVAAIAVLVGAIVWVCSKITGWASLWQGVVGFMKYTFLAFVDAIKLYFTTYINGFLIGLDKIRLGWYKFKEAVGMGDSEENQNAINAINESIEARKKAISDGAQSVQDNLVKAKESLGGIEMGWKKKEDVSEASDKVSSGLGTNEQLQSLAEVATNKENGSGNGNSSLAKSNEAIATGGTRNTSITINLGEMIGSVTFNGSLKETREDFERTLAESMFRVLAIAQSSVG
jgi:tape measure domain-containing protein